MQTYRLIILDDDGRVRRVTPLSCEDDAQARQEVASHRDGRAMELWRGMNLVATYAAERDVPDEPGPRPPAQP